MSSKPLAYVECVQRWTREGQLEELRFVEGLNLLVGLPNAGKSTWLAMLDYALGKEGTPENALGADMTEKYGRVGLSLRIGEASLQILRAWDDSGPRTKTQLNGEWLTASEFSQVLLTALEYPLVRFPQGNPYSDRTWPALTFRTALRHIYRSETDWSDLAPRQPESDQHAVLALFLGVAEELFPDTYGQMVDAQKRLNDLEAESAAYERILSDVTREILAVPGSSVTITPESTDISRQALNMELAQLEAARLESVTSLEPDNKEYFAKQAEARAVLVARMERLAQQREGAKRRLAEVSEHESSARSEAERLRRAQVAGRTLGRFPISVCPACLRPIEPPESPDTCTLCGAPSEATNEQDADSRIQFEMDQLEEELRELQQLCASLEEEVDSLATRLTSLKNDLGRLADEQSVSVLPSRSPARDAEVAAIDIGIGRVREKLEQLDRVQKLLRAREEYSEKADSLRAEIQDLQAVLAGARAPVSLDLRSNLLADGMNSFLNALNAERPSAWPEPAVSFRLKEREFSLKVGSRGWKSALGATLTLYFLFAYQYGLMTLQDKEDTSFPGFCILDLPPSLAEGPDITEYGDYAIRPFMALLAQSGQQLIVSGREFPSIVSAHRIELPDQWRV